MRLALLLLLVAVPVSADEAGLSAGERTERARAHFERGKAHFNLGEYEDAVHEFEAGYREKPQPLFLYNIANAARHAGMQRKALEMFKRYLQEKPDAGERAEVVKRIAELEPLVASLPPEPPPHVEPPPRVEVAPRVEFAPPVEVAPPHVEVAPPPPVVIAPPPVIAPVRPWQHDWVGATLSAVGAAALVIGAVEMGVQYPVWERRNDNLDAHHAAMSTPPQLYAAVALLPIGAILVASGALRYGLEARRQRRTPLRLAARGFSVEF